MNRGTSKTRQSPLTCSGDQSTAHRHGEGHAPTRKRLELGPVVSEPTGKGAEHRRSTWGRQEDMTGIKPAVLSSPPPRGARTRSRTGTGQPHHGAPGQVTQLASGPTLPGPWSTTADTAGGPTEAQGLSWARALGGKKTLQTQLLGPRKQCLLYLLPKLWPTDREEHTQGPHQAAGRLQKPRGERSRGNNADKMTMEMAGLGPRSH